MDKLIPGTRLNLFAFGGAVIRKLYIHPETKEHAVDVHMDNGSDLFLSIAYCLRVIGR